MINKYINGNIVISEFMGYAADYFYHKIPNWNLLMTVLERIGSIGRTSYQITKNGCVIVPIIYDVLSDTMKVHPRISCNGDTTLEAVWAAVVMFIKWHIKNRGRV